MHGFTLKIDKEQEGKRLDLCILDFLKECKLGISRTMVQKAISDGSVTLCSKPTKPHHKVKTGEVFEVRIQEKKSDELKGEEIPLDIVYQDEHLAVINKPVGLVVHPAPGNYEHTLVNALLYHFKKLSHVNPGRPGIIHRLDKDTSGLMLVVKDDEAHLALARQFARHEVKRQYVALVKGVIDFDEDVIEVPLGRHPKDRKKMSVSFAENTKYAKTHYRTLKRAGDVSLVQLTPFTGRTHQLRVHLAFIGHPILGDNKYGKNNEFSRLALHANYIGFLHPDKNKFMEFSTPIPKEFLDFIKASK